MDANLFEIINQLAGKVQWLDMIMIFSAKYLPIVFAVALLVFYLTFQAQPQRMAVLAGVATVIALGLAQSIALCSAATATLPDPCSPSTDRAQ